MHFEGTPGEFSQLDFGHVDVRFVGGRKKRAHFFTSRLEFSLFAQRDARRRERGTTIVRCLRATSWPSGGLPLLAAFDKPSTIVKKAGKGREIEEVSASFDL